jgi:hypothetical protein
MEYNSKIINRKSEIPLEALCQSDDFIPLPPTTKVALVKTYPRRSTRPITF